MGGRTGNISSKGSKGIKGPYGLRHGIKLTDKIPRQQPTFDEKKFEEALNYFEEIEERPVLPDVIHEMSLEDKQHVIDVYNEKIGKIHDEKRGIQDPKVNPVRPLFTAENKFIRKKAKEYGIDLDYPTMFDSYDWVNQKEKYFKIPDDELRRIAPSYAEEILKAKAEYKPETQYAEQAVKEQANPEKSSEDKALNNVQTESLGINKPKSEEINVDQSAINPEKQAVKQMIDAQRKPYIKLTPDPYLTGFESNGWYTPLNLTEDLMPSTYQANKELPFVRRQTSINKNDPIASANLYPSSARGLQHFNDFFHDPKAYSEYLKKYTDRVGTPEQREAEYRKTRSQYPTPDYTDLTSSAIGPYKPVKAFVDKNGRTLAGALTGLGVLAYPYLFSDNNEETLSEVPQEQSAFKSVSEPTLEQQYVSQGKPYDSRPPQSYSVEENLDASQIPLASQRTNALIRDAHDFIHSITPVETSSDNFTAPRELPANGETLDEYNSDSTPKSGVVLASDDTTSVNESRVLNKSANTRKPLIVNKPQEQVTPAPTPVSAESALVQNALSKEDLAKRDRAFRNAKYAALNANLAEREDALQRARYQSLMNSGLRGMSPSEAIKSGLLTPEQAYVLMRGPF